MNENAQGSVGAACMNDETADADILIVEDSQTQAMRLAHLLTVNGYRARIACNGRQGLAEARSAKPALIVSDISMPEMDGFAMCRELKQDMDLREVPVILLTALSSLYDVIDALDCGADNFIRKPYEEKYLLARVRFILANREFRSSDRVQIGIQINLGGHTHFVTAERQQIFDLLISTYEEAIRMAEELKVQQGLLARSVQSLEGLYQMAASLNPAINEKDVAQTALDRALDLPGIVGGCIKLRDPDGSWRMVAAHDAGLSADAPFAYPVCPCEQEPCAGADCATAVTIHCPLLEAVNSASPASATHITVPLALGGRMLGVMNLIADYESASADEKLHVLDTVRHQIAIALERAALYANMESLVSERTKALQAERSLLSAVVDTTGALVMLVDVHGRIAAFNPACEASLGWKLNEVRDRPYWELFLPPDDVDGASAFFRKSDFSRVPPQIQSEWIARDGSQRHILWSTTFIRHPDGSVQYLVSTGLDVTELRRAEEKVRFLSNFDPATQLPNRILLRDRMRMLQNRVVAGSQVMGFFALRFARLPMIRESLGSRAEQDLIAQIADRLKDWANGDDSVGRLGDISFAALAVRSQPQDLALAARQILAVLEPPFHIEHQPLHVEASLGITVFPSDGDDFDTLAQGAETAMRRAHASKIERYAFYTPTLNRGAMERFRLENLLRGALARDEMRLHFQPEVDLRTGKIVALEALVRWQHPELGLITPDRFIELAEETGLILPIGEWVLRTACEQVCAWKRAAVPVVPISVNLSARQFTDKTPDHIRSVLADTGMDPKLLMLELTESLSMEDPVSTISILNTIKGMGVGLVIDDFGTGYSNLNYLKRFPVDKIKLDRAFVSDLTSDPDDLAIASAVIAMAHSLRLKVIAEGVETEGQLALLAHYGCDEIQGYLFSKPVDGGACAKMLKHGTSLSLDKSLRHPYQRTLVFVDDEVNVGAALRRITRNRGYKVFATSNAAQAFEILATNEVGVIMCDQRMPGMKGTEFLSRVKQMYPAAVRMVLSGYTDLQSVTDAVNHGAIFKFLTKPWEEEELLAALNEAFLEFESKSGAMSSARITN